MPSQSAIEVDVTHDERRKSQRADAQLSVGIAGAEAGEAVSVSSINISAGGVYVEMSHFIEPLTKLALKLEIPGPTDGDPAVTVETDAIVVRTAPDSPSDSVEVYEVACAFLELKDEYRDAINRYILTHRAQSPA